MSDSLWLAVGFAGQACFFMRFVLQWLHSERQRRSVVPVTFWYLSLAGSAIVMVYAIYRRDPVFIVGQLTGSIVYIRNLRLIHNQRQQESVDA